MGDRRITRLDDEARDQRVAAGVLGHVALDLELALGVRLEAEARGPARRRLRSMS